MSTEENKALARRVLEEMFNKGNLDLADEVFAPDYVDHDPAMPEDIRGPERFKEYVSMFRTAFPDTNIEIEDQVAEGDKVVSYALDGHRHPRGGPVGHRPHRQQSDAAWDGDRALLGRQARRGLGRLRLDGTDEAARCHALPRTRAGPSLSRSL